MIKLVVEMAEWTVDSNSASLLGLQKRLDKLKVSRTILGWETRYK